MKNESGLHMVAWLVLAQVVDGSFMPLFASVMAMVYACFGLYECWRDRK